MVSFPTHLLPKKIMRINNDFKKRIQACLHPPFIAHIKEPLDIDYCIYVLGPSMEDN